MTTIVTRITAGGGATVKGAPLTNAELDTNFINLNSAKVETADATITLSGTGALRVQSGTTAQRPTPATGMIRYNTTTVAFEGYNAGVWSAIGGGGGGGARGGSTDDVFYENSQIITANYTVTSGKSAMSSGPITINSGVVVTVPLGSRWIVL